MTLREIILVNLIIVVFILIFVYMTFSRLNMKRKRRAGRKTYPENSGQKKGRNSRGHTDGVMFGKPSDAIGKPGKTLPCPLCGSILAQGERVRSFVYKAGEDRLSHIFGCPHCDPGSSEPGKTTGRSGEPYFRERTCPVCRKPLRSEGYLVARMFDRTGPDSIGKTHVHVLGCTGCRRG